MEWSDKMSLNLLPDVYQFIMVSRSTRHLIKLAMLVSACMITVETYYFTKKFNTDYLLQYAERYSLSLYACLITWIYPRMIKALLVNLKTFKSLFYVSLEDVDEQTRRDIFSARTRCTFVFKMLCIASISYFSVCNYYWIQNKDSLMAIAVLHKYVSKDSVLIQLAYCLILIITEVLSIPSVASPMYFVYVHFHMEVKLMMLTYYVTTLNNTAEKATQSTNGNYYKNVMTKLVITVEKHSMIKRYNNAFAKQLQLLYMLYICSGIIFGVSAVCTLISRPFKPIKSFATWITYVVFSMSLTHVSQCFEDASTNLSDAVLNLNWYNWNKPCQQSYLLIITNCLKGMSVSLFLVFEANYSFYKKVTRFLYAMGGFLYSIRK